MHAAHALQDKPGAEPATCESARDKLLDLCSVLHTLYSGLSIILGLHSPLYSGLGICIQASAWPCAAVIGAWQSTCAQAQHNKTGLHAVRNGAAFIPCGGDAQQAELQHDSSIHLVRNNGRPLAQNQAGRGKDQKAFQQRACGGSHAPSSSSSQSSGFFASASGMVLGMSS